VTDLLVSNARVLDGLGAPAWAGSVAVQGDRIEGLIPAGGSDPPASRTIDAHGLVVAPGFIDVHSHSDVTPFVEPQMDSMLRQGVTTMVVGNCGGSAFPAGGIPHSAALAGVEGSKIEVGWSSFGEYLARVDDARPALNVAALVGHGTLREEAMMGSERRAPSGDELDAMRRRLAAALEEGAVGLSSGLVYAPGLHATTDELVQLARELTAPGGIYASHVRGEGPTVFDAVAECIAIGRATGVRSHVSHLKVETRPLWGRGGELLELLDAERARGADVSADQYPYAAWETNLDSALPPWASVADLPEVLVDENARGRLFAAIERGDPGWQSAVDGVGWDRIVIGAHHGALEASGRSVAELAADLGVEPAEAACRLLLEDPHTGMVGHAMHEDDVRTILARPDVFVSTDALAISPDGPLGRFGVHPRYYGTYPRVLGRYVREERLLALETAVAKMTSLPAERFGIAGRGRIAYGAFADLVVFDPASVVDRATYDAPHAFAHGIELVVVNGRVAWDGGFGERSGRALRRGER
jgi:N-acyl-D-amino-acid deacylase